MKQNTSSKATEFFYGTSFHHHESAPARQPEPRVDSITFDRWDETAKCWRTFYAERGPSGLYDQNERVAS